MVSYVDSRVDIAWRHKTSLEVTNERHGYIRPYAFLGPVITPVFPSDRIVLSVTFIPGFVIIMY